MYWPYMTDAQVYATTQTNGANGVCIGCSVANAARAVDSDNATYATLQVTVGVLGAYVYQRIKFGTPATSGSTLTLIMEDNGLGSLNVTKLASMKLTSYKSGVSNSDTKTSSDVSIVRSGVTTKYLVSVMVTKAFDELEIKIEAGIVGALNYVRIYSGAYQSSVLPVTMGSFSGSCQSIGNKLNWVTYNEINNSHFRVERSSNGVDYDYAGRVEGAGNSTRQQRYTFTDDAPLAGTNYYRLVQTDFDSMFEIYGPVAVQPCQPDLNVVTVNTLFDNAI